MTNTIKTIIVGSHFSPPAKTVLKCLASGATVELRPEPTNPYDPNAIRVFVDPSVIDVDSLDSLEEELNGMGKSAEEVLTSEDVICLGHVAASNGKPLAKAMAASGLELVGTLEVLPAFASGQSYVNGTISFVGELAVVTVGVGGEGK